MEPKPEVQAILSQIESELRAMLCADQIGTITVHCGPAQMLIEVHRKLEPVKRATQPKTPGRRGWETQ